MIPPQQQLDFQPPMPQPVTLPLPASAQLRAVPVAAPEPVAAPRARELWAAVQFVDDASADATTPDASTAKLAAALRQAQSFTSRVAIESPDALLLELGGSQRLFGGLHPLLRALRAAFPQPLRLAMAPTPLAAVLLARAGRNCCITSEARLQGRLAPLPLHHLRWPEAELMRLRSMGVTCLGELLRLPRAGLARRIGPQRLLQLDQLTGKRADPRAALPATQRFMEGVDPDFETVDRERLLAALAPTLTRLEEFLRDRQRGVVALRVTLVHRPRAHHPGTSTACVVRCVVPEYRASRFTALLAARLESLPLAAPVRRLEVMAGRLRGFTAGSQGLWRPGEHGGSGDAQLPEFLQTLMARLGERAVYGLEQVGEHRPERQWRSVWPGHAVTSRAPAPAMQPHSSSAHACFERATRPLGLLAVPQALTATHDAAGRTQHLLHEGRALQLVTGPERIESGWWDGADIARDYYIARDGAGALWWVFRECAARRRWFLHGCFA
jgi:protein ImuB